MRGVKQFLINFLNRSGSYVFKATIISKLLSFLASWIALQLIPNKELGIVLFAFNIIAFIIPFSGLGLHQSLLRYGALLKTKKEKDQLFIYVLKKGIITSLFLVLVISVSSFFIPFKFINTTYFVTFLSLIIIPQYFLSIIKIQFRLKHQNKTFSHIEIVYNILLVVTVSILSYLFTDKGYAIALLITPFLTSAIYFKKLKITVKNNKIIKYSYGFAFWKYGFFASLAVAVSEILIAIDILLIGYLLNNSESVTQYKYITLIPFSLLFLSKVFITTDFVSFTEKIYDKTYIYNYMKRYMLFFTIISVLICGFSMLLSQYILAIFDPSFVEFTTTFLILIIGICGILIFRGLYGNLLSSIGKVHINSYIGTIAILLNIVSNYFLIPKYGINGAAITSSILMWFTGLISYFWFLNLYKKI